MVVLKIFCLLGCFYIISGNKLGDPSSPEGYRLEPFAGYIIIAPRIVRPGMTFRMQVSVSNRLLSELQIMAFMSQDGAQYAQATVVFDGPATRHLEMDVPVSVGPGEHCLIVEGQTPSTVGSRGVTIFRNETTLKFQTKYLSIFAQTDKPLYLIREEDQSINVTYRIIGVTPLLQPIIGPLVVYVIDGAGIAIRRWRNEQLNIGVNQNKFSLRFPVNPGNWTLRVEAFGHVYDSYFWVDYYYPRKIEVNVTVPQQMFDSEWGLLGTVYAEHAFTFMPAEGNATVMLRVRDTNGTFLSGSINKTILQLKQATPFEFTMEEIREQWGDVAGHDLVVKTWFYDWFMMEVQNATAVCHLIKDGIQVSVLGRDHRAFKPNQPVVVYFAVSRSDGTPYLGLFGRQLVVNVVRSGDMTVTEPDEKVIIPDSGIVRYVVVPSEQDRIITVRALHQFGGETRTVKFFKHHNRNDQYMSVTTSTEEPKVDNYMVFTIQTNFLVEQILYVITAQGNILLGGTLWINGKQKSFSVAISRAMMPFARLVVYTVSQGVVLTDSITFPVKDLRLSGASLGVNLGKDFHKRSVELLGQSYGGGTMILSGFPYQLYERGINSHLTSDDVLYDLMEYGEGHDIPFHLVWNQDSYQWESTVRFTSQTNGMDALQTFNASGLYIFTDMNITDVPEHLDVTCNITLGLGRCPNGQCYEIARRCDQVLDCADGYDEMDCALIEPITRRPPNLEGLHYSSRLYVDTNWMFKTQWIKPNGQMEMMLEIPKSMQTFAIGGFALHPDEGLTIAPHAVLYDTARKFFMRMECPPKIRRGEQVGVRMTIFNLQDEDAEVLVTLHGSDNYKFVNVEPNGYSNSYAPKMTSGDIQVMVYMEAGAIKYIHFPVWSVQALGEVEVTVSAYTFYDSDIESCTMSSSYDGVLCEEYTPYLIDLVNQGSVIIPDLEIITPEQFFNPDYPYHLYVPGSPQMFVLLFGDIVAPGFHHLDYWSTSDATGLSHDSADGFIADFAFNFQMLRYLEAVNTLKYEESQRAFEFMRSSLAQQYTFILPEGGMKMFRFTQYDKPSIWVTHFALRWLHAAAVSNWNEELFIPMSLLNSLAHWLANKQRSDGSFLEIATTYDIHMEPFSRDADGNVHEWRIGLTAEVLITLCGLTHISGTANVKVDAATQRAAAYLTDLLPLMTNPYEIALTAYALAECGHPEKDHAFYKLHSVRRESEYIYWSIREVPPNLEYIQDTVPIRLPRDDILDLNHATTATSYALMLYLRQEPQEFQKMTVPIMKWINDNRIGPYGWSSTRDTLLALEALTEFAMSDQNRFVFFMQVKVTNTHSPDWEMVYNINNSNFDVFIEEKIPVPFGFLKTRAIGTGYAVIALSQFSNVERDDLLDKPEFATFEVRVPELYFTGRNHSTMHMEFCIRFIRPDLRPDNRTHLTWIFVELPTGYVPNRDRILELYAANITGVREVNFRKGWLHIFLEFIYVYQEVCIPFKADRWYPAANMTIQQVIRMNEYVESALMFGHIYTTYSLHNLHVCLVCGSYQCPYCPYYNHAPVCFSHQLLHLHILAAVIALIYTHYSQIFCGS